uniref:Uncharacterized protein n=1 Tax=Parascaris equorum TaxID=6256 RepID=A0A914R5A7_PAREQ
MGATSAPRMDCQHVHEFRTDRIFIRAAGEFDSRRVADREYEYQDPKSDDEVVNVTFVLRDGTKKKVRGKVGDNLLLLPFGMNDISEALLEKLDGSSPNSLRSFSFLPESLTG